MATEDLVLLQEIDHRIEEIVLTVDCSAWNEERSYQILDALLFIVKRTAEPRFQIILKPAWPISVDNVHVCRFHWVESSDRFEEEGPRFLFPSEKRGFVVFFDNLEDTTRARNCIERLVDTIPLNPCTDVDKSSMHNEEQGGSGLANTIPLNPCTHGALSSMHNEEQGGSGLANTIPLNPCNHGALSSMHNEEQGGSGLANTIPLNPRTHGALSSTHNEEQGGSGLANTIPLNPCTHGALSSTHNEEQGGSGLANGTFDQYVYLQNSRVIMAMIAVLLATIVLTVGLNPPSTINTLSVKIIFQITFWIAAVFSLAALFMLGRVTPTSYVMQIHIFRCAFMSISVALICVVVAFGASMVSMTTNLGARIVGGFIGVIGIIFFSYFTSTTVREFIFTKTGFRLTQDADNNPYSLTCFWV